MLDLYNLSSQLLFDGGIIQNPAFILLNYIGPEKNEGNKFTTYITAGFFVFTTLFRYASIAKLVSLQFLSQD